jgi:hypothetical protein
MNGFPVDPLKIKSPPANPVSPANFAAFKSARDRLLKELRANKSPTGTGNKAN